MKTIMNKNITTVISEEERSKLVDEIFVLLENYGYTPTETGVNRILDTWIEQKGWLIELMKKHPNYLEGKYMIAFDVDYDRTIDRNVILSFCRLVKDYMEQYPKPYKMYGFTYSEVAKYIDKISDLLMELGTIQNILGKTGTSTITIDGKTNEEYREELQRFQALIQKMACELQVNDCLASSCINGSVDIFLKEDVHKYKKITEFFDYLYYYPSQLVKEDMAVYANMISDKIRAKEGQRTSRLVNKICKFIGFDKTENYNKNFAYFADSINPIKVKRHTIISCNPIDYFTMSFGNSWSSCHTIDKEHKRNDGSNQNYQGRYSGGTLSYMLDDSSVVFYTVDKSFNGVNYELQDKINRCMFHLGEDKLVQGRVYPQCNDGENSIYKTIREIVQKIFADCLGVPNLWHNVKGVNACYEAIISYGEHYRDYENFGSCNVSYLKRENQKDFNYENIIVGHEGICPCCGKEHNESNTIECYDCWTEHEKI